MTPRSQCVSHLFLSASSGLCSLRPRDEGGWASMFVSIKPLSSCVARSRGILYTVAKRNQHRHTRNKFRAFIACPAKYLCNIEDASSSESDRRVIPLACPHPRDSRFDRSRKNVVHAIQSKDLGI